MIRRDLAAAREPHDLVIVGGGIHGAAVALAAVARGLRPLVVEAGDFGGGTTANSLRVVHGGMRYLQHLDLARHRDSVLARRWLLASFPELVVPLPCLLPLDGRGSRRPAALRAAFALDALLAADRNRGVPAENRLPAGRVLGAAETRARHPGAGPGTRGGALWSDGVLLAPGRLVIEMLRWATAHGATAINRLEAVRLVTRDSAVAGVIARDRPAAGGATHAEVELTLRAPVVVVATGGAPPFEELHGRGSGPTPPPFAVAFNLLLSTPLPSRAALGCREAGGARNFFLVPVEDCTLAGTCHVPRPPGEPPAPPDEAEIAGFLAALATAAPFLDARPERVLRVLWGPQPARRAGDAEPSHRALVHDHGAAGGPRGLWCLWGAKLTTAHREAERLLARIAPGRRATLPTRPAPLVVPRAAEVEDLVAGDPAAVETLAARLLDEESAHDLDDLLLRRTDWGFDPRRAARLAPWLRAAIPGLRPARSLKKRPVQAPVRAAV